MVDNHFKKLAVIGLGISGARSILRGKRKDESLAHQVLTILHESSFFPVGYALYTSLNHVSPNRTLNAFIAGSLTQLNSNLLSRGLTLYVAVRSSTLILSKIFPNPLSKSQWNWVIFPALAYVSLFEHTYMTRSQLGTYAYLCEAYPDRIGPTFDYLHGDDFSRFPSQELIHPGHTCTEDCLREVYWRFPLMFRRYLSLYAPPKVIAWLWKGNISVAGVRKLVTETARMAGMFWCFFVIPAKYYPCLARNFLNNNKSIPMFLLVSMVGSMISTIVIPPSKQHEINLYCLWRLIEHILQIKLNLKTDEKDKSFIGSRLFKALVFGFACALWASSRRDVGGAERLILSLMFPNQRVQIAK